MKNIKVAVFGGAFDPPHKGHLDVVRYLRMEVGIDQVEVAPSGLHRHKGAGITDPLHRLEMTDDLFHEDPNVNVSDFDILQDPKIEGAGSTYNLMDGLDRWWDQMKHMAVSFENYEMCCVIGQDNADKIKSFYKWEELLEKYSFIVFPRGDKKPEDDAWYTQEPHIYLKDFDTIDISSTDIRSNPDSDMLPYHTSEYIKRHNLYGLSK
jgi:nicotinate-nucleotide adenylyltransferase